MNARTGGALAPQIMTLDASADYLGNGAIETNRYETEVVDIIRRNSVFLDRVPETLATGHPHRFFDQTTIAQGNFSDVRTLAATPSGPTRTERAVYIKAAIGQTNFGLFDVAVTRLQKQFSYITGKDIEDIMSGVVIAEANAVWAGTATSISDSATPSFCGLLTQISNQYTIGLGASIIDGLKAKVAAMFANPTQNAKPTAVYLNPILSDLVDREAKAAHIDLSTMEVSAGVVVTYLNTQAGRIPLIPEPFIPATTDTSYGFATPGSGNSNYFAVIVTEDLIERPVVPAGESESLKPTMFQLGLVGGLQGQYVCVHFSAVVAKRADTAHAVVAVVRPTVTAI